MCFLFCFFFKKKTAYEMRISDWSSDVCSSDLPSFSDYTRAIEAAQPAVNVAALGGHTALRSNHMDRLDRVATRDEVLAMREQLREALAHGAIGLSTGRSEERRVRKESDSTCNTRWSPYP